MANQLKVKKKWINEALEILDFYPLPVLQKILRSFNLNAQGNQNGLLSRIKKKIESNDRDFIKLTEKLDELARNGRQYIFFYQLIDERYLERLRDENKFRNLCQQNINYRNLLDRFNNNMFLWEAESPQLVEIRHHYVSNQGELLFKWLESRGWNQNLNPGKGIPKYIRRKERSVNFFIVNLNNGLAELRLQLLQTFPQISLWKEFEIYKNELKNLISFDLFIPLPLEPVIRRLMRRANPRPKTWEIVLPEGGNFMAKGSRSLYRRLRLPTVNYFARRYSCEWTSQERDWGYLHIQSDLDAEKNMLTLHNPCDPLQISQIIGPLNVQRGKDIEIPIFKSLAKEQPDLKPVLIPLDTHFTQLEKNQISMSQLINNELLQKDIIQRAFGIISEKYKENFSLDKKQNDQTLLYIKKILRLKRVGLTSYMLNKQGIFKNILKWLERKVGEKNFKRIVQAFVYLIFFVFFTIILIFNLWAFSSFIDDPTLKSLFTGSICIVNILYIISILILIFGKKVFLLSIDILDKIIEILEKLG